MAPDPQEFRRVMGLFATGVTVLTTWRNEGFHAMTANALSSLSLEPPLVLVCIDKRARTHHFVETAGCFAVNILGEEQVHLSNHFARSWPEGADMFESIPYHLGEVGCPLLEGCLAYLECRLVGAHDGGDHTIFVGQVKTATAAMIGLPLIFYQGAYWGLRPPA